MLTLLMIILGVGVVFGIAVYVMSSESNPKKRAQEAAGAAAGGAMMSMGCMLQAVMSALPVLLGLLIIGLIFRSCS